MSYQKPPVEPGDIRTVSINAIGEFGDGIAHVERGYVIIVADAVPDEEVRVEVEDVKERFAFAHVIPSAASSSAPIRQEPPESPDSAAYGQTKYGSLLSRDDA